MNWAGAQCRFNTEQRNEDGMGYKRAIFAAGEANNPRIVLRGRQIFFPN